MRDEVMDVVRASFRPEFLNRVDEIILFHRLRRRTWAGSSKSSSSGWKTCSPIARSSSTSTQDAIDWLAAKGYDPAYGARPLKRVIQKELQDPLAERILLGEILDGSTVKVTAGSDRLNFRAKAGEPAETEKAA